MDEHIYIYMNGWLDIDIVSEYVSIIWESQLDHNLNVS